jgi:hypothetical protein
MRSGCCPDPEPAADGTPGQHLIRSHHYKNVFGDDGNHISAGTQRPIPWVAITPVVRAIRILERIVPEGELLFSAAHHDFAHQRVKTGALKNRGMHRRIGDFIRWANREAEKHGLSGQVIPDDPQGPVAMIRFRRTLAWHIARRPGGLVALAIQYGHMRTVLDTHISSGYASRSSGGMHSILDIETALAADPEQLGEQLALLIDGASARTRVLNSDSFPTAAAIAAVLIDNAIPASSPRQPSDHGGTTGPAPVPVGGQ